MVPCGSRMIEITFRGRGGQGTVVASEILGRAYFLEGKYPQCFSVFGGERRGAPVMGFVRVDDKPILLKCQITRADQLVLFDLSLIDECEIEQALKPGGVVLINATQGRFSITGVSGFRIGAVDAASIARSVGLGGTVNTAMLGAYARLTNAVSMETLIEAVKAMVPAKAEANVQALRQGYAEAVVYQAGAV